MDTDNNNVQKNTAFIIMEIKKSRDVSNRNKIIKEVFINFSIDAVRADDIQHSKKITDVIIDRIKTSEFIIADLTSARPNVYYEVGYAHAIGKEPILIRKKNAKIHFDLAGYNVPAFSNNTELRKLLTIILKSIKKEESNK